MNEKIFRIKDDYPFLTEELLRKEYLDNNLTDKDIAVKYGIGSKATIWRRRKFFDIKNRFDGKSNTNGSKNRKFNISLEDAKKWKNEGKDYNEMANIVGCSRMVICRRLKELGLVNEMPEAMKNLHWHDILTELQIKILLGTLLGDGNITPYGMFQCNHSSKQYEYIKYKREILSNLLSVNFELKEHQVKLKGYEAIHAAFYLRTQSNKAIKEIHDVFYKNGIKIFPYDYLINSCFDEYSLAIWYMDDGSKNNNSAILHTDGFSYECQLNILRFLWNKFSIKAKIRDKFRQKDGGKTIQHYIALTVEEAKKFFNIVYPHILPMFRYKIPPFFLQDSPILP